MNTIIQGNENEFFIAFRQKMDNIMKDMMALKQQANGELLKLKQDEKMVQITSERDWFRNEALKLNKLQKDQKLILDRLKQQLEASQDDRDYYQQQLYEEKMNSKGLAIENMKMKSKAIMPEAGDGHEAAKYVIDQNIKSSDDSVARMKRD